MSSLLLNTQSRLRQTGQIRWSEALQLMTECNTVHCNYACLVVKRKFLTFKKASCYEGGICAWIRSCSTWTFKLWHDEISPFGFDWSRWTSGVGWEEVHLLCFVVMPERLWPQMRCSEISLFEDVKRNWSSQAQSMSCQTQHMKQTTWLHDW